MRREAVTADEIIATNHWHKDVRDLAGDVHDIGFDDAPEARQKLHALVALCSEQLARLERRERLDAERFAREEMETSVPSIGGGL